MKKVLVTFFNITLLLLSSTFLNAQISEGNRALKTKIDNYLSSGVQHGFSGAVLVVKQGDIILNKGYGLANKEKGIPYTSNTIATVGSVTKQFTATAILKLESLNKLKVTDPISKFFNNLPDDKKDITIHQLLTHSAGLIDVIGRGDFDHIPMKQFFETLFASELRHQPGTKYAYSNAGYSILARVIEIVSGQDYESFLNENLFKPAGMHQTGYFMPQWKDDLIATGYMRNVINMGSMISRYQNDGKVTWTLKGNGGINSTPGDMFKWYKALKSNKILSNSQFKKLTTPYIPEGESGTSHYAYGWAIFKSENDTKIISHNGGNAIFFHDFIWLPQEDILVILFTNASSREVEVAWPIEKMILDENYQPKPIKKNLYFLVFDFMKNNDLSRSHELTNHIRKEYGSYLRNSDRLNNLGYMILESNKNAGWAVELFKLNTELFPTEGNLWDSLGDGFLADSKKEEAIKSYKRALELAPEDDCFYCESSTKSINKLEKNQ